MASIQHVQQLSLVLVKMLAEHGAHNRWRQYKEAKERLVEWRVHTEDRSGLQQWAMEKRWQKGEQERIGENYYVILADFNAYLVSDTVLNAWNNSFISLKRPGYYFLHFIGEEIEAIECYLSTFTWLISGSGRI